MKIILIVAAIILVLIGCSDQNEKPIILITSVNIIDINTGTIDHGQDILIKNGVVVKIADSIDKIEFNANKVIDGKEKFVIPGLWDMHVHLTDATEIALTMFIVNGVIGVRDMGGDLTRVDSMIARIQDGSLVGPVIFRPGNYVDGEKNGLPYRITLSEPEDVDKAIMQLKSEKVDFVKVHNLVPRDLYFNLIEEADKNGLDVVGHIPVSISPYEAVNAGHYSIEHMNTLFEGTFMSGITSQMELLPKIKNFVDSESDSLITAMKNQGAWMTPNLLAIKVRAEKGNSNKSPDRRRIYVAKSLQKQWDIYFPVSEKDSLPEIISARYDYLHSMMELTRKFQNSQIGLLAGSDLGLRDIYPGSGLYDELVLLTEAGLTPLEALKCATINPAKFLKIDDKYGTIEVGKKADLVILDKNPLSSINNVREISYVLVGMTIYDKERLDQLKDQVKSKVSIY